MVISLQRAAVCLFSQQEHWFCVHYLTGSKASSSAPSRRATSMTSCYACQHSDCSYMQCSVSLLDLLHLLTNLTFWWW